MVSCDDGIHTFLHIPPITPKSKWCLFWLLTPFLTPFLTGYYSLASNTLEISHALVVAFQNIRYQNWGQKTTKKRREKLARVDNEHRRDMVELARKWIYEKSVNVKSKPIQGLLDPKGWTPTRVRSFDLYKPLTNHFQYRMPFQKNYPCTASTSTRCLCRIYFTSLNWVFGRLVSLT